MDDNLKSRMEIWGGRRFYLFSNFLKKHFPFKVGKITLDAGFTCPNLDGSLSSGGCIYCNNKSFSIPANFPARSIKDQIQKAKEYEKKKKDYDPEKKYLAYFQAYSNTYSEVKNLKTLYDAALEEEGILGLDIGTRPDCVSPEILDLIQDYAKRSMVWLEYGLQSASNSTLKKINRGHDVEAFVDAVQRTKDRGIWICAHVILGFPWESKEEMLDSIRLVSDLKVDGIKIHHLYVAKDTVLEKAYLKGKAPVMSFEEYLPLLCDALEILDPGVTIHRLTGDLFGDFLVAPQWNMGVGEIYDRVQKELERRDSFQGSALIQKQSKSIDF